MKSVKSMIWAVTIRNIIVMICWTALAIYFGKWWIALFAVFFFASIKWKAPENAAIDSPIDKLYNG